jgi:hypothetical protein
MRWQRTLYRKSLTDQWGVKTLGAMAARPARQKAPNFRRLSEFSENFESKPSASWLQVCYSADLPVLF